MPASVCASGLSVTTAEGSGAAASPPRRADALPAPLEAALKIIDATDARPEMRGDIAMNSCVATALVTPTVRSPQHRPEPQGYAPAARAMAG